MFRGSAHVLNQSSSPQATTPARRRLLLVVAGDTGFVVAKIAVAAERGVTITGHQKGRPRQPFASSPFWRRSMRVGISIAFDRARSLCCFVSGALENALLAVSGHVTVFDSDQPDLALELSSDWCGTGAQSRDMGFRFGNRLIVFEVPVCDFHQFNCDRYFNEHWFTGRRIPPRCAHPTSSGPCSRCLVHSLETERTDADPAYAHHIGEHILLGEQGINLLEGSFWMK